MRFCGGGAQDLFSNGVIAKFVGTFVLLDFLFFAADGPMGPGEGAREMLGVARAELGTDDASETGTATANSLALRF